jgi:hypothetical protein
LSHHVTGISRLKLSKRVCNYKRKSVHACMGIAHLISTLGAIAFTSNKEIEKRYGDTKMLLHVVASIISNTRISINIVYALYNSFQKVIPVFHSPFHSSGTVH